MQKLKPLKYGRYKGPGASYVLFYLIFPVPGNLVFCHESILLPFD